MTILLGIILFIAIMIVTVVLSILIRYLFIDGSNVVRAISYVLLVTLIGLSTCTMFVYDMRGGW